MAQQAMAQQAMAAQKKKTAYAWSQYFQSRTEQLGEAHQQVYRVEVMIMTQVENIPDHIKTELIEMAKELKKKWTCPICRDFIVTEELSITNCGHYFCQECLDGVKLYSLHEKQTSWKCPCCRRETKHK